MIISNNFWKIFFSFLILLLVLVMFFGWEIYNETKDQIEAMLTERYQENLTKTIRDMDEIFRRVEVDMLQLSEKSALLNFKLMRNRGEYVDELLNLQDELEHMKTIHTVSDSYYYYDLDEGVVISDHHGSYSMDKYYDREWFELFQEIGGGNQLVRLPIREYQGEFYYTIVFSGSDFLLVANLNTEKIYDRIKQTNILSQERILVSNREGYLIHSYNPFEAAMEQNQNINKLISNLDGDTGVFQKVIFEEEDFIVVQQSDYNNWFYLLSIPLKRIEFQWVNFRKVIMVNLIPFGIIGIFLVSLLVFLIYGPYNKLAESLRKTYRDYDHKERNAFDYIRKIIDSDISRIAELEDMVTLYKNTTRQKVMIDYLEEMISREEFEKKMRVLGPFIKDKTFRFYLLSDISGNDMTPDKPGLLALPLQGDLLLIDSRGSDKGWSLSEEDIKNYSGIIIDNVTDIGQFPMVFERMSNSLEYVKFYNLRGYFRVEDFENPQKDFHYPEELERKLLNTIHSGDYSSSTKIIDDLFKQFQAEDYLAIWTFRRVVSRLLFAMLKQLPFKKALEFDVLQNTILKNNIVDIRMTMHSMCLDITSYLQDLNRTDNDENVYTKKAKTYIDEHFQKDISLEDIAAHLKISYPYLSKIFKEGANENILYYINKKRIEKSKEFLKTTDKTMQEIAQEVGYNNTQSFSRFFKKREGITPGKYKKIKNESQ